MSGIDGTLAYALPPEGEGGAQRRKGDAGHAGANGIEGAIHRTSPFRPSGTFPLRGKGTELAP
jgi:hypothetical protein